MHRSLSLISFKSFWSNQLPNLSSCPLKRGARSDIGVGGTSKGYVSGSATQRDNAGRWDKVKGGVDDSPLLLAVEMEILVGEDNVTGNVRVNIRPGLLPGLGCILIWPGYIDCDYSFVRQDFISCWMRLKEMPYLQYSQLVLLHTLALMKDSMIVHVVVYITRRIQWDQ